MSAEALSIDTMVPDNSMTKTFHALDYAWGPNSYSNFNAGVSQPLEMPDKGFPNTLGAERDQNIFADAMSSFTHFRPPMQQQQQYPPATTIDPTNMWQPQSSPLNRVDSKNSSHSSTGTPTVDPTDMWQFQSGVPDRVDSKTFSRSSRSSPAIEIKTESEDLPKQTPAMSHSPAVSDPSLRARHAANQRHSKVEKARRDSQQNSASSTATEKKKERLREKNKFAAAKCRQRQRRQAQSIQEKGALLSEANARLKGSVQELRGELNGLRALALYHQGCNCQVVQYNCHQAERVAAEYSSTYSAHSPVAYQGQTGVSPS